MSNIVGAPNNGPQIWYGDSPTIVLARSSGNESQPSGTVRFRIFTPDSRLRVKVSVLFSHDDPDDGDSVQNSAATLYLGEEEQNLQTGRYAVCTDILRDALGAVVHQSAPLAIPEDVALEGFTTEFVTAADSILGIFFLGNPLSPVGHWSLQVRFQPDGQRLCDEDWEFVKRGAHATLISPALFF